MDPALTHRPHVRVEQMAHHFEIRANRSTITKCLKSLIARILEPVVIVFTIAMSSHAG